jgi:HD superfamily phosphohydrolase
MQITFYNDNYHVCITEKHLPFVEGYLFARYQMYRNVYMDTYKIFTEELLRKIIKLAKESYANGSIDKKPIVIPMFSRSAITVKDFCGLDDHVLMGSILEWSTGVDKILSMLCKAFLDRAGFDRLDLLENRKEDILLYKKKFLEICGKYINLPESTSIEECGIFESFYFWVENIRYFSLYNDELTKIYFQCDNGLIKELVEISPFSAGKKESRCANYIHYGLLRLYYEDNKKRENKAGFDLFLSDVQKLIDSFSPRRQLEIESKYVINHDDEKIFSDVIDFIKTKKGYVISEASVFYQKDTYFDYKDNELFKSGKSIRMRSKKDKYVVTYKETIADFDAKRMSNQTIRIEREIEMDNPDIIAGWPEIKKSLPELALIEERKLAEILVVENNRTKYNLSNGNFQIELVLDDVVYSRENSQKHREKHIEIELLSSYEYRINLKLFTELLETHFGGRLIANSRSKLERGLSFCQSMAKT